MPGTVDRRGARRRGRSVGRYERGRKESIEEGGEEKNGGAVLLCFDGATGFESAWTPYRIGRPPFPDGVLPPRTL